ncbi:MAG: hypothetical protein N4A45_13060 [Flavobacteriales bacterium]|jgi:iron complex transport system substrate-binding protein|nr:hypothetical protein [Flavobacteriales bacterium]
MIRIFLNFCLVFLLISCNQPKETKIYQNQESNTFEINWAKNFQIIEKGDEVVLKLFYQKKLIQEWSFGHENSNKMVLPLQKIGSGSCEYSIAFEVLGQLEKLQLIDFSKYHFSNAIRKKVSQGIITEVSDGVSIIPEKLFAKKPDIFIASGFNYNSPQYQKLEKLGINILYNFSFDETHPLGRAEWIKVIGLLTGEWEKSVNYFKAVEKAYLDQKKNFENQKITAKKTLINGPYLGSWHIPNKGSYMEILMKDAGFFFPNKKANQTVSSFTLEEIFIHFSDAPFWINPGMFTSLEALKNSESRVDKLKSFSNKKVFSCFGSVTQNGGNDYFEMGYLRPDKVLKDLQNIRLEKFDTLYFFKKL